MTARLIDLNESDYHGDKTGDERPSLSASVAKILTSESPAHAYLYHPRLGGQRRETSKEMDNGSIVHELVLGTGGGIEVVEADSWRTNAAKDAREAAYAAGKTPVLSVKYAPLQIAAQRIKEQIDRLGFDISGGLTEQTILWEEYDVLCRGRMDRVWLETGWILDFKTCASAHPDACAKALVNNAGAIQAHAYQRAVAAVEPELEGRTSFLFLFAEIEPPYCVTPIECGGTLRALGENRWQRAVRIWSDCLRTDRWPGYAEKIVTAEAPAWALAQEMEEEVDG